MKVCVMGGAGKMAQGAVRESVEDDEVEQPLLAEVVDFPAPLGTRTCFSTFTVGFLSAVTALLFGRGVIRERCASGGEACIPPEAYSAECDRRDIRVDSTLTCAY